MNFEKLIVVLPCRSIEGYSLDREVEHADELLSAWSALYHPALLADAGTLPRWVSADEPPQDPGHSLILVPPSSQQVLAADWPEQATHAGACVIAGLRRRDEMIAAALERLDAGAGTVDRELAADFLALGFCHLQMEVLIRDAGYDMGTDAQYYDEQYYDYMGQFDRDTLEREAVAAATAAVKGEDQEARDRLGKAFAQLTDARRGLPYTYSTDEDPHLVDLTLVAPTTLGQSLRDELAGNVPTNLLISGQVLDQLARQEPATLAALREAASKNTVVIVGGEFDEHALTLLTPEGILDAFRRGMDAYERHLAGRPAIFGRRRFGLSPALPQILRKLGFAGAVHFTLDEGQFPTSRKSKIWWVGIDGTEVEALAQVPVDAARASNFLNFASLVSNTSYQEHNATAVLAHWPGRACPWYRDLQRMAAYSPVLGEFRTITDYFERSQSISEWTRAGPDDYRSPYLKQDVARRQPDPISRWVRYHRGRAAVDALGALRAMADLAGAGAARASSEEDLLREVEDAYESAAAEPAGHAEWEGRLRRLAEEACARFAEVVPRTKTATEDGYLVANPWSFSRRVLVDASKLRRMPAVEGAVRAVGESAGQKQVVVEVPAMGFAWVGPGSAEPAAPQAPKRKRWWARKASAEPPMVEGTVLRNEHFEVEINPITGAIQAIDDYVSRGARLAQQIAFRQPRPKRVGRGGFAEDDPEKDYSIMAADKITVASSGPVVARIVCRGRLVSRDGERLARFVETIEARRGSPILQIEIELDVEREPDADPWNSYYAARFAWGDAAADVYRGVCLANRPTELPRVESPHFLDIRSGERRMTILTGGLPYHRQIGLRKLDTLLVVRGETARTFRLGIGVNLTHPVPAALDFLAPDHVHQEQARAASGGSGWLFHVDAKNVIATHWSPIRSGDRITGFRARLLETEGRAGRVSLTSFRPIKSARKTDFQGKQPTELSAQGDKIPLDLKAHEWAQLEAEFG